ncbi:MAG: hypothetical protein GOMPHAMPRED_004260 [Gomphillus americanus]|uniref:Amidohydrolase-related domain-containing protein n=1 Tax=Gomphillus americanus TaxID=1940652 RepID=A0A8H3FSB2_9LECA|nr:MAG: hypothetical protein GOMPHAMPRED_004260 [Gomphillus americanus]
MKARVFLFLGGCTATTILFQNATIIGFNDALQDVEIYRCASLLIENDRVMQLVNNSAIKPPTDALVVDASDKIISPGFVDTHHHLWQTAFKTLASNTTLAEYFQKYGEFGPVEDHFSAEDIYLGQLAGSLEMIHGGTTTVLDHAHGDFSDAAAYGSMNGSLDSGLRTFYAHALHPLRNKYPIEDQIKLFDTWVADPRLRSNGSSEPLVSLGLAYDFFVSPSTYNLSALWNMVQSHNLSIVTCHYLGGPWGYANSPEAVNSIGWLNGSTPIVFAHGSFATQTDFYLLRQTNQYLSITSESEQHYGHGHPWSRLIMDQSALGIDTHFTYSGSMVQQARNWVQSVREQVMVNTILVPEFKVPANSAMSVRQAFSLITRHGGLAFRRDDLGVIKPGAKADIVVFDGTTPNMLGWNDPIAAIVLHSNLGDIEHVLIDGKFVKKDGKLTYPDYKNVQTRFIQSAQRIQNIWLTMDWGSLLGGAINGVLSEVSMLTIATDVDTLRGNGTGY